MTRYRVRLDVPVTGCVEVEVECDADDILVEAMRAARNIDGVNTDAIDEAEVDDFEDLDALVRADQAIDDERDGADL